MIKSKKTNQAIALTEQASLTGVLTVDEIPETDEFEISKTATAHNPAKRIRFPKENFKRFRLLPERFKKTQNAVEEWNAQVGREREVFPTSMEGNAGYSSLFRVMRRYYSERATYFRSKEGGKLSPEQIREKIYAERITDEKAFREAFDHLMTIPVDWISFNQLFDIAAFSTATAENVWEVIKREAAGEFESGHTAANALEPIGSNTRDAWTRAKYLAIRESFCEEYQPTGGIEISMIDLMAQNWFMTQ